MSTLKSFNIVLEIQALKGVQFKLRVTVVDRSEQTNKSKSSLKACRRLSSDLYVVHPVNCRHGIITSTKCHTVHGLFFFCEYCFHIIDNHIG